MAVIQTKYLILAGLCLAAIIFAACTEREAEERPPLTQAERAHAVEMWSGFELPKDARIVTEDHAQRGWSFSFLTQNAPVDVVAQCDQQIASMGFTAVSRLTKVEKPLPGWLSSHRSKYSNFRVYASKTPKGTLVGIEKVNRL